jgi:hypothetical protein
VRTARQLHPLKCSCSSRARQPRGSRGNRWDVPPTSEAHRRCAPPPGECGLVNADVLISVQDLPRVSRKADKRERETLCNTDKDDRGRRERSCSSDRRSPSPRGRVRVRAQSRSRSQSRSPRPVENEHSGSSASKGKLERENDVNAVPKDKKAKLTDEEKRARLERNKVASAGVLGLIHVLVCVKMWFLNLLFLTHQPLTPKN